VNQNQATVIEQNQSKPSHDQTRKPSLLENLKKLTIYQEILAFWARIRPNHLSQFSPNPTPL